MIRGKPKTALEALTRRRFLLGSWPWRALAHLLGTPVVAGAAALALFPPALPWAVALANATGPAPVPWETVLLLVLVGGVLLGAALPVVAAPVARVERWRLRLVDTRPLGGGSRRLGLPRRYTDAAAWREAGYTVLLASAGALMSTALCGLLFILGVITVSPLLVLSGEPIVIGVDTLTAPEQAVGYAVGAALVLVAAPYPVALLAAAHAAVGRALLGGEPLRAELVEVSRSRARLVDLFEAERRRIERDLHDGAQERLVGLTLRLGLARVDLPPDSPAHDDVVAAHDQAKQLMTELRELVRGIHPRVLTDRGLAAALGELADRSAIPVAVEADLPERLPAPVEATAYFVVSEALANAAKHSGATGVSVTARVRGGALVVEVADDGVGGADPAAGTGLTGLADRVAVLDGRLLLSSPAGGPTAVRAELPCAR
ncbi:sensor histidine kinase [Saccharothrix coeruleofusca]|nr:sensor domain-containing protein [Saccharothrix coeruleofusca]